MNVFLFPGSNEVNLGPFGAQDKRFPMPGLVGLAPIVKNEARVTSEQDDRVLDILSEPLPQERHQTVFETYMTVTKEVCTHLSEGFFQ